MITNLSTKQVFNHEDIESMTGEERKFAYEQLRSIYSRYMSKVSMSLSHQRQISSNLLSIEKKQEYQMKKTFDRLNEKMSKVYTKRQYQLRKRIQSCHVYDERWKSKMTEVEKKLKQQSRQAFDNMVRMRSYYYSDAQKKKYHESMMNYRRRTLTNDIREQNQEHRYSTQSVAEKHMWKMNSKVMPLTSRGRMSLHNTNKLDQAIKTHRLKSQKAQSSREYAVFQRALFKLDTINQRRKKLIGDRLNATERLNEEEMSEAEARRKRMEKNLADMVSRRSISPKSRFKSSTQVINTLERSQHRRMPFDHIDVKRQRYERYFVYRGSIMYKMTARNKKDHILRQIRQKVLEYKVMAQRNST